MPLLTWQLWLAKDLVRETCLLQAKTALSIDAWKGRTINASTFNQDWDSHYSSQTRKEIRPDGNQENLAVKDVAIL